MITEPTANLEKRKISQFTDSQIGSKSPEELKKIFLGGYEDSGVAKTNVKVNLNDIIIKGAGTVKSGTVLKNGLSADATFSQDGYEKKTVAGTSQFLWAFNVKDLGVYIQIDNIAAESYTEVTVNNQKVKVLDVAFIDTTLGQTIKLYLPDFGPQTDDTAQQYAVRIWQKDPKSMASPTDNPFDCNNIGYYVFTSKPVTKTEAKSYDWMVSFVELAAGMDGSVILRGSRVHEVLNINDNDGFENLESLI